MTDDQHKRDCEAAEAFKDKYENSIREAPFTLAGAAFLAGIAHARAEFSNLCLEWNESIELIQKERDVLKEKFDDAKVIAVKYKDQVQDMSAQLDQAIASEKARHAEEIAKFVDGEKLGEVFQENVKLRYQMRELVEALEVISSRTFFLSHARYAADQALAAYRAATKQKDEGESGK